MKKAATISAAAVLLASTTVLQAQTIQSLTNQMPEIPIYGFVLTDGSALIQGSQGTVTVGGVTYGDPKGSLNHWFKLTPDATGSYLRGIWKRVANATTYLTTPAGSLVAGANGQPRVGQYSPYAGGGAVMPDGRLALIGGEYRTNSFIFTLTNEVALYDPAANSWSPLAAPQPFNGQGGFSFFGNSTTTVLPNGSLLVGQKLTKRAVALDPKFYTWVQYGQVNKSKNDFNSEEGWTLLPDGSILTADVLASPRTERLIPAPNPSNYRWVEAGKTPVDLRSPPDACCIPYDAGRQVYNPPGEIGPAILRPDGTVFATGGIAYQQPQGHTAIFHPGPNYTGTWTAGPDFLTGDSAGDNFGVLEPNGNVLVAGDQFLVSETEHMPAMLAKRQMAERMMQAHGAATAQAYPTARLYEFNGTTLKSLSVGIEAGSTLLPLPSGQVLVMGYNEQLFTPADTSYDPAWAPTIGAAPSVLSRTGDYKISGTQFNGLSQACAYGDEFQCATNYPLVRITNKASGHVFYARTHDHSTMAVATGSAPVSTNFAMPSTIETGPSMLQVVANGIPSIGVDVAVQ